MPPRIRQKVAPTARNNPRQQQQSKSYWASAWRALRIHTRPDRKIELILVAGGVAMAAILGVISYFQLGAMKEQSQVMKGQLDTMKEQVELADKTMRANERPWVVVKGLSIANEIVAAEAPKVALEITNIGHTPAMRSTAMLLVTIVDKIPGEGIDLNKFIKVEPGRVRSYFILSPNVPLTVLLTYAQKLTAEDVRKLYDEKLFLLAFGSIDYLDVFKNSHRTTFCFTAELNKVKNPKISAFNACGTFNSAN